jgi:hypothetical protein
MKEETKKKLSIALKKYYSIPKHRETISKKMSGRKLSEEHKKHIGDANRNPSIEIKLKNSLAKRGNKNPMYGVKQSEETRKKKSEIMKLKASRGKAHYAYKGGRTPQIYPTDWNNILKEQIRARDNYTCQECGCPEIECNRRLDVHHIDYDKNNLDKNNLISLCRRCHNKTNHNREYWERYFTNKEEINESSI